MTDRVLVAYATRAGSTAGVAAAIGETLTAHGFAVDVASVTERPPVGDYQAVVIGSAVQGGRWLPEAVEFARANAQALGRLPVALFCVHIMNLGDNDKSRSKRVAYLDAVRPLLPHADEAYHAGMVDPARQPAVAVWFNRLFKIVPMGDSRDWDAIRGWAESLWSAEEIAG